jgi:hypothetical protein
VRLWFALRLLSAINTNPGNRGQAMNQEPDLLQAERTTTTIGVNGADLERTTARVQGLGGIVHGTYRRRKKPTPFVMNRNCEFVTAVGLNNPPFQSAHIPPTPGLN